jgi:hypothetical protein
MSTSKGCGPSLLSLLSLRCFPTFSTCDQILACGDHHHPWLSAARHGEIFWSRRDSFSRRCPDARRPTSHDRERGPRARRQCSARRGRGLPWCVAEPGTRTATLPTGDRVTVIDGAVSIRPAAGHEKVMFHRYRTRDHRYVVPDDVTRRFDTEAGPRHHDRRAGRRRAAGPGDTTGPPWQHPVGDARRGVLRPGVVPERHGADRVHQGRGT